MGKYEEDIISEALKICLDKEIYNAGAFADIAKTLQERRTINIIPQKVSTTTLRKVAIKPYTRDINSYQSLMS